MSGEAYVCDKCLRAVAPPASTQMLASVHRDGTLHEGSIDVDVDLCDACLLRLCEALTLSGFTPLAEPLRRALEAAAATPGCAA